MGSAHDLVVYVPHGGRRVEEILSEPFASGKGQSFTRVSGFQKDLPGSGQAGSPDVWVLCLRSSSTDAVVDELRARLDAMPSAQEVVVLVNGDYVMGPTEVHRLGYEPSSDPKDWL